MKPICTTRMIQAPRELVFQTIAEVRNFQKAVPHIVRIEFLTEQQHGVGTRFRETRIMNGHEQSVDLEVTEFVDNYRVRLVSDAGGTIWDTLFTVSDAPDGVQMNMHMVVRPYKFFARIVMPLIRGMVVKNVESDMEAVKAYCESNPISSPTGSVGLNNI